MDPQKLVNCVAIGLLLMNVLLMHMIADAFRADYNIFESMLADRPESFNLVLERLLMLSEKSMAQLSTVESSFLNIVLEDGHSEKTFGNHKTLSTSDE